MKSDRMEAELKKLKKGVEWLTGVDERVRAGERKTMGDDG